MLVICTPFCLRQGQLPPQRPVQDYELSVQCCISSPASCAAGCVSDGGPCQISFFTTTRGGLWMHHVFPLCCLCRRLCWGPGPGCLCTGRERCLRPRREANVQWVVVSAERKAQFWLPQLGPRLHDSNFGAMPVAPEACLKRAVQQPGSKRSQALLYNLHTGFEYPPVLVLDQRCALLVMIRFQGTQRQGGQRGPYGESHACGIWQSTPREQPGLQRTGGILKPLQNL
jgi:hypothetical protein